MRVAISLRTALLLAVAAVLFVGQGFAEPYSAERAPRPSAEPPYSGPVPISPDVKVVIEPASNQASPAPMPGGVPADRPAVALPTVKEPITSNVPREAHCGKYEELLRIVHAPQDVQIYGRFNEYGYSATSNYAGQLNLPAGYWVYVEPNWYIWQQIRPVKAARDILDKQVTVWLDNGTPVGGVLVETTPEYLVLALPADSQRSGANRKLIYKAKATSIDWTSDVPARGGHKVLRGPQTQPATPPNYLGPRRLSLPAEKAQKAD